jgi:ribosomal-protein-alanine N-acetyltransferase
MYPALLAFPSRIETEHLFLRAYQTSDANWYYAMSQRNKLHLAKYESSNAIMRINTLTDADLVLRDFVAGWTLRKALYLGAFRKDNQEFVAQIYIGVVNWDLPEFELGYFADLDHQGKGFVTEAAKGAMRFIFEDLGAHRVRLECDDTNERSFRVAERCGMIREGHIRENQKHADGSVSGTLLYGLLKQEYSALRNSL